LQVHKFSKRRGSVKVIKGKILASWILGRASSATIFILGTFRVVELQNGLEAAILNKYLTAEHAKIAEVIKIFLSRRSPTGA
jgi:hypothetical protein